MTTWQLFVYGVGILALSLFGTGVIAMIWAWFEARRWNDQYKEMIDDDRY